MRFLCEAHKQMAAACPNTAITLWHDAFHHASEQAAALNWQMAWRAFGTALDLALLIHKQSGLPTASDAHLERVTLSCQNLAICLYQLNRNHEADAYLLELHDWLTQLPNPVQTEQPSTPAPASAGYPLH